MTIRNNPTLATVAAAAAFLATSSALGAAPVSSRPNLGGFSRSSPAQGSAFFFKGHRFVTGSAWAQAEAMRRRLNPNFTVPNNALYVADPSLNAVVIYNAAGNGTQYPQAILSGFQTQINSPVGVSVGYDLPCNPNFSPSANTCQRYLFVSNQNGGVTTAYTLPLTAGNQAPYSVFTESCAPGVSFPYGIVDLPPATNSTAGNLLITNEGTNSIQAFGANVSGSCVSYSQNSNLHSPSGPSALGNVSNAQVYNANSITVTGFNYANGTFGALWYAWSVGSLANGSAYTEGTAVSATHGLYVTTSAGNSNWPDAVWRCKLSAFPGCPSAPAYTNAAKLSNPTFPGQSDTLSRLFVPNANNGTAIALKETGANLALAATYINLANPFSAATDR